MDVHDLDHYAGEQPENLESRRKLPFCYRSRVKYLEPGFNDDYEAQDKVHVDEYHPS